MILAMNGTRPFFAGKMGSAVGRADRKKSGLCQSENHLPVAR